MKRRCFSVASGRDGAVIFLDVTPHDATCAAGIDLAIKSENAFNKIKMILLAIFVVVDVSAWRARLSDRAHCSDLENSGDPRAGLVSSCSGGDGDCVARCGMELQGSHRQIHRSETSLGLPRSEGLNQYNRLVLSKRPS